MSEVDPYPHTPAYPVEQPAPGAEQFGLQQLAPRRKRRTGLIAALVIAAVLVLAAGGTLTYLVLRGDTFTISGSLTIASGRSVGDCIGTKGYDDIRGHGQVTVTDAAGAVVAVGALDSGESWQSGCRFQFSVANVPSGKGFYGIEVGNRSPIRYAEADLKDELTLSLG
jgi:hypothetical protein